MRTGLILVALLAVAALACSAAGTAAPPTKEPPTALPPEPTETSTPRPTETSTPVPSPTATPNPGADEVARLQEDGLVGKQGRFVPVESDFWVSEARRNTWFWLPLAGSEGLQDYVVGADISWETASEKADWHNTGCGFFVRPQDETGLGGYFVAQTADGLPWLLWSKPGSAYLIDLLRSAASPSQTGQTTGSQHIVAIAEGPKLRFFVDGQQKIFRDDIAVRPGSIGVVIVSGTNKDFGTRCTFTDVWVYALGAP